MRIQVLISALLLLTFTFASIISSNTTSKITIVLPPNCLSVDDTSKCILCAQNYLLQNGTCYSLTNFKSPLCANKSFCGQIQNFKSNTEMKNFLMKSIQNKASKTSIKSSSSGGMLTFPQSSYSTTSKTSTQPAPDQNRDYSTTNNQINGVDEADIIKTDGTYIYTLSNEVLSILIGYTYDRSRVLSEISLKNFYPHSIFIQGDTLAVFGVKSTYIQTDNVQSSTYSFASLPSLVLDLKTETHIKIYNISNRIYPVFTNQLIISGNYFNGRKLSNGFMYLLTTQPVSASQNLPWYDLGAGQVVSNYTNIFYYPDSYQKATFVNIISFDLKNPLPSNYKMITVCTESPTTILMSEYYLYLASSYVDVSGVDYTKMRKIFVYQNYIQPFGDGNVVGKVLNQFSLDQSGDYLRVVTTSVASNVSSINVATFDFYLQSVGILKGIAKGQAIKSTRFLKNRLYLAASTINNPFFVISLMYPTRPTILGEVRIQGFPNYLQLYDESTVIGIGQQTSVNGQELGLKISIFNVSDVRYPNETATFQLDQIYATSIASKEHKAFLLSKAKNLLVIPSYLQSGSVAFNGAFIFYINSSSIELKAVPNHVLNSLDDFSKRYVQRSLYIQDHVYTKSKCLMRINKIGDLYEGLRNINIPCVPSQNLSIISSDPTSQSTIDLPSIDIPPIDMPPIDIAASTAV